MFKRFSGGWSICVLNVIRAWGGPLRDGPRVPRAERTYTRESMTSKCDYCCKGIEAGQVSETRRRDRSGPRGDAAQGPKAPSPP